METVFIKETEKEYKIPWLLIKKNRFFQQGDICVYKVPRMKRKKAYLKVCRYLKKKGVKNVCFSRLTDPILAYDLKSIFHYINGEGAFYGFFIPILEFFAQKKGILLKDSTVVFISNDVEKTEKLVLEIYKKVKMIAVYTRCTNVFENLSSQLQTEYGIYMDVRNEAIKPKRYRHIYINTEKFRIMEEDFLKNCLCLDIYKLYKNAYNDISFYYKTPFDTFLKEYKIEKRLSITEFFVKNVKKEQKKDYKIMNIIKL